MNDGLKRIPGQRQYRIADAPLAPASPKPDTFDMPKPLTQIAHELLSPVIQAGDFAVDATVGNGHDTRFLAEQVGDEGKVLGLDVQESAILVTAARLGEAGLKHRVDLVQKGHEQLDKLLPEGMRAKLKVVMFNLGYLPGGDHGLITRADTTLKALDAALGQLRPDGLISLMVYRGHPGGNEEYRAITDWLEQASCRAEYPDTGERPDAAPVLMHIHPDR
jgi:SAM-dependent methyltransferase